MTRRYTYSRAIKTPAGLETFTAQEWDSFDEAKTAVDKGIRDRMLQVEAAASEIVPPGSRPTNTNGEGNVIMGANAPIQNTAPVFPKK